jgi:hypothetical protein
MNILPRRENYENPYIPLIADTGFLSTGIDNPDNSATNKAQALAAQIRAIEDAAAREAIAAGTINAGTDFFLQNNRLGSGNLLGGKYAFNSTQPAPKVNKGGGNSKAARKAGVYKGPNFGTPAVLQDNTSFNPANTGGTFRAGGG